MSHEAVDWAFDNAPMIKNPGKGNNTKARLVLVALARHAHADGTNAFPAQGKIEYVTGLSESSVKRALADLEKAGLIVRAGTRGSGVINWSLMMQHQRPSEELVEHVLRKDAEREAKAVRMAKLRATRAGQADTHISADEDVAVSTTGTCAGQGDTHIATETDTPENVCGHPDTPVRVTVTACAGHGDPENLQGTSNGTFSVMNTGAASLAPAASNDKEISAKTVVAAWERGRKDAGTSEGFGDERQRGLVQKEAKRLIAESETDAAALLSAAEEAGRRGLTAEDVLSERAEEGAADDRTLESAYDRADAMADREDSTFFADQGRTHDASTPSEGYSVVSFPSPRPSDSLEMARKRAKAERTLGTARRFTEEGDPAQLPQILAGMLRRAKGHDKTAYVVIEDGRTLAEHLMELRDSIPKQCAP